MQPCAVCGSVTINTAGYCAQCGTYRGVPGYHQQQPGGQPGYGQQGSGPPAYGQQTSGPPAYGQQTSGPPTYGQQGGPGGYPVSGAPGYPASSPPGYPASSPPGYPVSGTPASYPVSGYPPGGVPPGGYPGYPAQPGHPGKGRSLMIPLIALGSTLAVLVVAIVVVLAVRGGGSTTQADPTDGPGPTSVPTTGPSVGASTEAGIDSCIVGTWRATSHEEVVTNEQLGKLTFTGGEGAELTLGADGEGETDYGNGTEFESVFQGKPIVLAIRGTVRYAYQTDDGQVTLSNIDSDAENRVYLDGEPTGQWIDFRPTANATSYTCRGNDLTQKSLVFTTTYRRLS